ncbi:MAG: RDD family protein [Bdellovibrionales bacterium]
MLENGDFDFKPLTKGLGFHKKKVEIDEDSLNRIKTQADVELPELDFDSSEKSSGISDIGFQQTVATTYVKPKFDLLEDDDLNLDQIRNEFRKKAEISKTLPRETVSPVKMDLPKVPSIKIAKEDRMPEDLSESFKKPEFALKERTFEETVVNPIRPSSGNLFAPIIDSIVLFGVLNLFVASLLFVTKLDVFGIVSENYQSLPIQLSLGGLLVFSMFIYTVVCRSIFGRTLGDWTLDLQLGEDSERESWVFPLKASLRFFVVLLSGLIVLPILSLLFGTDLAGKLSGTRLFHHES